MEKTIVFMAAGFGTRFGGGIKQLEPVGPHGEVLMDYAVHDALSAGFGRVIFIIRRELEALFREGVGARTVRKCEVAYAFQEVDDLPPGFTVPEGRRKPWGTGHAVLACRELLDAPFCVLNADDYYGPQAFRAIHDFLYCRPHESRELCMAGYALGNTLSESGGVTRGLCRVEEGQLKGLIETKGIVCIRGMPCVSDAAGVKQPLDPASVVSMNIWGLPPEFIQYLETGFSHFLRGLGKDALKAEYLLPSIIGALVASGRSRVHILPTRDHWFGMTYARDKALTQQRIRELIDAGAYPSRL